MAEKKLSEYDNLSATSSTTRLVVLEGDPQANANLPVGVLKAEITTGVSALVDAAQGFATDAGQSAAAADASVTSAASAADAAGEAHDAIVVLASDVSGHAQDAAAAQAAAQAARDAAAGSAGEALGSAQAAAQSATDAGTAATGIDDKVTAAGAAQTAAEAARDASLAAQEDAETAANAAQDSQEAAAQSATDAGAAVSGVAAQVAAAAGSASDAQSHAQDAEDSAQAAETASGVSVGAKDAAVAAQAASEAAQTASESARDASVTAQTASEAARGVSEAAAETAGEAVTVAQAARDAAAQSVTAAAASETAAATNAETAGAAVTAAQAARDASVTAKTASEAARDAAAGSATTAGEKATAAAQSAVDAQTAAGQALDSKTAAAASETAAATSETNAAASASAADTAKTAAETARDEAVAAAPLAQFGFPTAVTYPNGTDWYSITKSGNFAIFDGGVNGPGAPAIAGCAVCADVGGTPTLLHLWGFGGGKVFYCGATSPGQFTSWAEVGSGDAAGGGGMFPSPVSIDGDDEYGLTPDSKGSLYLCSGSPTMTLPDPDLTGTGDTFTFCSTGGSVSVEVFNAASDTIGPLLDGSHVTSLLLVPGETATLVADWSSGGFAWRVTSLARAQAETGTGAAGLDISKVGMAFVGDSLTEIGTNVKTNWYRKLCFLSQQRYRFRASFAVSGATTAQVESVQLPQVLAMSPLPRAVVLASGSNDYTNDASVDSGLASLGRMIDALVAAGIQPILWSLPPRGDIPLSQAGVCRWNAALWKLRKTRQLPMVDAAAALQNPGSWAITPAGATVDGTHPSTLGCAMIAQYALADPKFAGAPEDGVPSLAIFNQDPSNLTNNGLFMVDSGTTGVAFGVNLAGGAVGTLRTDTELGRWQRITRPANATLAGSSVLATFDVTPGEVIEISARMRTSAPGPDMFGDLLSFYCAKSDYSGGVAQAIVGNNGLNAEDGIVYERFTVPADMAHGQILAAGMYGAATAQEVYAEFARLTIRVVS